METILIFIIGLAIGILLTWFVLKREANIAQALYEKSLENKKEETEKLILGMKESFGVLSHQALSQNSSEFLKIAELALSKQLASGEKDLVGQKALIDQSLQAMRSEMVKVQQIIAHFERDRVEKFGQLSQQLQKTAEQTSKLQEVTSSLKNTMTGTKARGQWGERMAEDILKMAGMKEHINYHKQKQIAGGLSRPDFTFLLPRGQQVNMDVKFPFNNYLKYLEAEQLPEKKRHADAFIKDVKARIKEATGRNYINPKENTVDYVLVFIPNEQVYSFIHEQAPQLLDEALQKKVILCAPFTLYAILSVIRQAVDNFALEQTASDILAFMREFRNQWLKFTEGMEKLGRRIDDTQKEYHQLITTRKRQLDKSLNRIDALDETKYANETQKQNSILFPDE